jgi:hypothetical protein
MFRSRILWAAVMSVALFGAGCEREDTSTPTTPGATPAPSPTADGASSDADRAVDDATGAVGAMKSDVQDSAANAERQIDQAAKEVKQDTAQAADQAKEATGDAQKQITEVMNYIKENKLDLAEQGLTKLEANKASLPATIQPQVDQARKLLDAAKAKAGAGVGE